MNCPRAESVVPANTGDLVEYDAVAKAEHPAGVLFDDPFNRLKHPGATPAVGKHLDVEDEPSILAVRAQRGHDLVLALHFDELARLQPKRFRLRTRASSPEEGIGETIGN